MEKRRENKCIVLTIPRSQWINRKHRLVKAKMKATFKKVKTKILTFPYLFIDRIPYSLANKKR